MMTNEEIDQLQLGPETHPLLVKELAPLDDEKIDAKALAQRLMKIMVGCSGAGLSANQVGVDAQMFVMQWPNMGDIPAGSKIVINPELLGHSPTDATFEEGCLSFPASFLWLKRPDAVAVRYQTVDGETVEELLEGWPARIFQHEYDHIKGLTFRDKASKIKLEFALKKRNKIFKRAGIDYKKVLNGQAITQLG